MMSKSCSFEYETLATAFSEWKSDRRRPLSDVIDKARCVLCNGNDRNEALTQCFQMLVLVLKDGGRCCNCDALAVVDSWTELIRRSSDTETRQSVVLFLHEAAKRTPECLLARVTDAEGVIREVLRYGQWMDLELATAMICIAQRCEITAFHQIYPVRHTRCRHPVIHCKANTTDATRLNVLSVEPSSIVSLCGELSRSLEGSRSDERKERAMLRFFLVMLHDDTYRWSCPDLRRILIEQKLCQSLLQLAFAVIDQRHLRQFCLVNEVLFHYLLLEPLYVRNRLREERERMRRMYLERQGQNTAMVCLLHCLNIWFYASLQEVQDKLELLDWVQSAQVLRPLAYLLKQETLPEELGGYCIGCQICARISTLSTVTSFSSSGVEAFMRQLEGSGLIRSAWKSVDFLMDYILTSGPPENHSLEDTGLEQSLNQEWSLLQSQLYLLSFLASAVKQDESIARHCQTDGALEDLVGMLDKARYRLTSYSDIDCLVLGARTLQQLQNLIISMIYNRLGHPLQPEEKGIFRTGCILKLLEIYADASYVERTPIPVQISLVKKVIQTLVYLKQYTVETIKHCYPELTTSILSAIQHSFRTQDQLLLNVRRVILDEHGELTDTLMLTDLEMAEGLRQLLL